MENLHKWLNTIRLVAPLFFVTMLSFPLLGCQSPSDQIVVSYHRSGGLAGLDETLEIYADGRAVITKKNERGELNLEEEELTRLIKLFEDQHFSELDPAYLPKSGADLIHYDITYAGNRVRTADTAIPEALKPIIQELNQMITS